MASFCKTDTRTNVSQYADSAIRKQSQMECDRTANPTNKCSVFVKTLELLHSSAGVALVTLGELHSGASQSLIYIFFSLIQNGDKAELLSPSKREVSNLHTKSHGRHMLFSGTNIRVVNVCVDRASAAHPSDYTPSPFVCQRLSHRRLGLWRLFVLNS